MRIIGFNLTKILIEKEEKSPEKVQINQNINIKEIVKEKIPISDLEVLRISFNLSIDYNEKYAKLEFNGNIIIIPEEEEMKKLLESWKNKKIPDQTKIIIFNFIMNKCNIKALYLEDELNLPYHIPMPRITPEQQTKP